MSVPHYQVYTIKLLCIHLLPVRLDISIRKLIPENTLCLTRILPLGHQEHRAAVGGAAHQRGLHRDGADHGLGQQGHRDQERGDWTSRWGLHAQEGTETEIFV